MSIQNLEAGLSKLEGDAKKLQHDSASMVEDLGRQARVVEEDVIAAEFIATEETLEGFGSLLDSLQRLSDIQKQQFGLFVDDGRETLSGIRDAESATDYIHLGFEHILRRGEHIGDGIKDCVDVVSGEANNLTDSLFSLWKPFFRFLRRDWSG